MHNIENNPREMAWKARGFVILSSDEANERIPALIQQLPHCHVTFTKSGDLKIIIKEVGG